MILSLLRSGDLTQIIPFLTAIIFMSFFITPLHEFAHGYVAYKLGDNTAKASGRLTLNPFVHIDLMGSLSMLLIGYGWAKPVPVNSYFFKKPKRDMALTALAGPLSNLISGFLMILLYALLYKFGAFNFITSRSVLRAIELFFSYFTSISVSLAVFNLIPIPPFDGFRIFSLVLPDKAIDWLEQNSIIIRTVFLGIMFFSPVFSIVSDIANSIIRLFFNIVNLI